MSLSILCKICEEILDTLLTAQISSNQLGTASLVGRDVVYRSDRITLAEGTPGATSAPGAAARWK